MIPAATAPIPNNMLTVNVVFVGGVSLIIPSLPMDHTVALLEILVCQPEAIS